MKKIIAFLAAGLLLTASACSGPGGDIEIVVEETNAADVVENTSFDKMSPARIDVSVPVDYPDSILNVNIENCNEILQEEAFDPEIAGILGADKIIRYNDWDIYYFTASEIPAQFIYIPFEKDHYLVYYKNAYPEKVFSTDKTWYFGEDGLDFMVYTYVLDGDDYPYFSTFYDKEGKKIFGRSGVDYFDGENLAIIGDELNPYRERYGSAVEFDYNNRS